LSLASYSDVTVVLIPCSYHLQVRQLQGIYSFCILHDSYPAFG